MRKRYLISSKAGQRQKRCSRFSRSLLQKRQTVSCLYPAANRRAPVDTPPAKVVLRHFIKYGVGGPLFQSVICFLISLSLRSPLGGCAHTVEARWLIFCDEASVPKSALLAGICDRTSFRRDRLNSCFHHVSDPPNNPILVSSGHLKLKSSSSFSHPSLAHVSLSVAIGPELHMTSLVSQIRLACVLRWFELPNTLRAMTIWWYMKA